MFGRNKTTEATTAEATHPERDGAKNRPTPRRRDQEAARKQPLVVTDRKKAKAADREKSRERLALQRQAMLTGDDKHLPVRDKGPVRRFLRDSVDARWNVGEFMLPVMVVVLALSFLRTTTTLLLVTVITYSIVLVAAVDTFLLWRRVKKAAKARFGDDVNLSGGGMYTAMRAFQMRRTRMPKPMVERGAKPA